MVLPVLKLLLTCAHVLCPFGFNKQDAVEQPPDPDGAIGPNRVGRLTSSFTVSGDPDQIKRRQAPSWIKTIRTRVVRFWALGCRLVSPV